MANVDIIKLSQQNKPKYDELIKYIAEYWEYLTYEELLVEIQRDFKLELTKGNLETIRISANLPRKVDVSASKRKSQKVEIPEQLARAIFLEYWDMRLFLTIEERDKDKELREAIWEENSAKRDIEKFGKVFTVEDDEIGRVGIEKLNEVDTDNVKPLIHMSAELNVLREDVDKVTISHEEALRNAPKKDSDYFRGPKFLS